MEGRMEDGQDSRRMGEIVGYDIVRTRTRGCLSLSPLPCQASTVLPLVATHLQTGDSFNVNSAMFIGVYLSLIDRPFEPLELEVHTSLHQASTSIPIPCVHLSSSSLAGRYLEFVRYHPDAL